MRTDPLCSEQLVCGSQSAHLHIQGYVFTDIRAKHEAPAAIQQTSTTPTPHTGLSGAQQTWSNDALSMQEARQVCQPALAARRMNCPLWIALAMLDCHVTTCHAIAMWGARFTHTHTYRHTHTHTHPMMAMVP